MKLITFFLAFLLAVVMSGCSGTFELYHPHSPPTFKVANPMASVTPQTASAVLQAYCINLSSIHSTDTALALALGSVSGASGIPALLIPTGSNYDTLRIVLALTTIATSATGTFLGAEASSVSSTYTDVCKNMM